MEQFTTEQLEFLLDLMPRNPGDTHRDITGVSKDELLGSVSRWVRAIRRAITTELRYREARDDSREYAQDLVAANKALLGAVVSSVTKVGSSIGSAWEKAPVTLIHEDGTIEIIHSDGAIVYPKEEETE